MHSLRQATKSLESQRISTTKQIQNVDEQGDLK